MSRGYARAPFPGGRYCPAEPLRSPVMFSLPEVTVISPTGNRRI